MWFLELNASWIITLYRVCYFSLLFCIWRVLLKIVHTQPHEGQYSRSPMQNNFNGIHTKCHIFVSLSPPLDLCPAIAGSNQGSSTDDSYDCLKKLVCRICTCIRKGNIQLMHLRINKVMFLYFNCLLWYYHLQMIWVLVAIVSLWWVLASLLQRKAISWNGLLTCPNQWLISV